MKKSGALLAAALLAASVAQADGFYVLGAVGMSDFKDVGSRSDLEDFAGLPLPSYSDDSSDTAFKFQVGYQFNENFAIEGGYVDLGGASAKGSLSGVAGNTPYSYTAKVDAEAKGFNVAGLLILPTSSGWSLFFKVGAIRADVDVDVSEAGNVGTSRFSDKYSFDDSSVKGNFGVGVAWNFAEHIGVRAEIERFSKLGDDEETGESDVDLYSIGAYYRF